MFDLEELRMAAENGVPEAQNFMASLYLEGNENPEIKQDINLAVEWFERSVQLGNKVAMVKLGEIYCYGEYGIINIERGILLLEQAASLGDSVAMGDLGFLYSEGIGVDKDKEKGFEYFLKAAESGNTTAMRLLARLYQDGDGVERNVDKANYWIKKEEIYKEFESVYPEIEALSKKGNQAIEDDDLDYARKCFQDALELVPEPQEEFSATTWLHAGLGEVYFIQDKYDTSLEHFMYAYNANEGYSNPYILYMLGKCYYELDNVIKAKEFLTQAYMLAGEDIFQGDNQKYINLVETLPPS